MKSTRRILIACVFATASFNAVATASAVAQGADDERAEDAVDYPLGHPR